MLKAWAISLVLVMLVIKGLVQWNQMNLYNSQFSEFYRRNEKRLGLDIIWFVNFSYIDYMVSSMFFQIGHTNATKEDVHSLEGQKKA